MTLAFDPPRASRPALEAFRLWVLLTQRPFDQAARRHGPRAHPLQGRPRPLALSRRLIRRTRPQIVPAPSSGADAGPLPRRLWLYWDQGEAAAPEIVRLCLASWRRHNPDWEITCLDGTSPLVQPFFAALPGEMGTAHRTDLLRLALLDRFGGVWADASALCMAPLDRWLPERMTAGFFAFRYGAAQSDRRLGNWFLAGLPGSVLARAWLDHAGAYWQGRRRADHYFIHHYLFDWMLLTHPALEARWKSVPELPADDMHLLQGHLKGWSNASRVEACFRTPEAHPVQKLDWRMEDRVPELLRLAGPHVLP